MIDEQECRWCVHGWPIKGGRKLLCVVQSDRYDEVYVEPTHGMNCDDFADANEKREVGDDE